MSDEESEQQTDLTTFAEESGSKEQTALTDFADESTPGSRLADLERRLDGLESDQEATIELIERVIDDVDKLTSESDETGEEHQPPTDTEVRGYY